MIQGHTERARERERERDRDREKEIERGGGRETDREDMTNKERLAVNIVERDMLKKYVGIIVYPSQISLSIAYMSAFSFTALLFTKISK